MERAAFNKARNTSGKFAPKSKAPPKIRSVNLTDDAWEWLAVTVEKAGVNRNDYLEALAQGDNPLMETVKPPITIYGNGQVSTFSIYGNGKSRDRN